MDDRAVTTRPDLLEAARALAPTLVARAAEVEAARRVPEDLSLRVAEAGFYRAFVPASVGGDEQDPAAANAAVEELARHDASVAWVSFIAMTSGSALSDIPEAAAKAIFATPTTTIAGVFAPQGRADRGEGGYRVSGRWSWGSGSDNADWLLGGCRFFDGDAPERGRGGAPRANMVLLPRRDVAVLGDWDASGLCGTGSGSFETRETFVPEAHVLGLGLGPPQQGALYRFPRFGLLALGIAAVALGSARAAIDDLVALAREKTPTGSRRTLAHRTATQGEVARAEAGLRAARLFFYDAIERCHERAVRHGDAPLALRREMRLAAAHAVEEAVRVVDAMYALGGGSAVHRSHPLQRRFRDVHVATQHMMVAPPVFELIGRTYLDVEADTRQL